MKFARLIRTSVLLFILVLPLSAVAGEFENPLYKHWASFPVGTTVTSEGLDRIYEFDDSEAIARKEIVTLKAVTNEYVTLEEASQLGSGEWKTRSMDYPRVCNEAFEGKLEDCGEEEVEVAGQKIKCRHYRNSIEGWVYDNYFSADIPGETQRYWDN